LSLAIAEESETPIMYIGRSLQYLDKKFKFIKFSFFLHIFQKSNRKTEKILILGVDF
jgi:hypothetical protein